MPQQALLALPLQGWSLSQHGERHSHHDFRWEDCGSLGRGKPMIKCCAWIEKVTSFTAENGVQETIYSGPEMYLPCSVTHWIHPLQSKRIYIRRLQCCFLVTKKKKKWKQSECTLKVKWTEKLFSITKFWATIKKNEVQQLQLTCIFCWMRIIVIMLIISTPI